MESPESYLPETFPFEIYSLDESIHPSRDTTRDHSMMDWLTSIKQWGKEDLERHRLDNPGASPGQFPSVFLMRSKLAAAAAAEAEAEAKADAEAAEAKAAELASLMAVWTVRPYGSEGEWSKKNMVAVRDSLFEANSLIKNSPKFVGTKTTLEFIPTGAKKAVLGMTQYNMLRPKENSDGLYLDVSNMFHLGI